MTLHWWFLTPTLISALIAAAAFYVRKAEDERGEALYGIAFPPLLSRERYPTIFKLRLASWWLLVAFGVAGAVGFGIQFLGLVA
jgi:hypothetical protein